MNASWLDLLAAAFSGGIVVKLLDYIYEEYRRRSEASTSAKKLIDKHLDPILKSADELVGKIRSLAQTDFREMHKKSSLTRGDADLSMAYLDILYLLAQFWARIQILRLEGIYVNLSSKEKGRHLLDFLNALEATKTRLTDRAWQRGIGESLIEQTGNRLRTITFHEFVERYRSSKQLQEWFQPIVSILDRINHSSVRQRLLVYGVILHALIDDLDKKHLVTRDIPGWANKMTMKNRRILRFRIFHIYLHFVEHPERYYEEPTRRNT